MFVVTGDRFLLHFSVFLLRYDNPTICFKCDVTFVAAVQNERQPRNSAQVRQDQLEAELDNPLAASHTTVSATHPAFNPAAGHPRYLPGPVPLDHTGAKMEPEDRGKLGTLGVLL